MEYGAIDLHKKENQIRIVTESGETFDRRIATTRGLCSAKTSRVGVRRSRGLAFKAILVM